MTKTSACVRAAFFVAPLFLFACAAQEEGASEGNDALENSATDPASSRAKPNETCKAGEVTGTIEWWGVATDAERAPCAQVTDPASRSKCEAKLPGNARLFFNGCGRTREDACKAVMAKVPAKLRGSPYLGTCYSPKAQ